MKQSIEKRFRSWVEVLRGEFPEHVEIQVRRERRQVTFAGVECHGTCDRRDNSFVITVSANDPHLVQRETLLHEWAHAIAWPAQMVGGSEGTHDDVWAIAYGQVYRKFYSTK